MLLVENRDLLDRFRAGDPAALKTVYLHYQPRVAGFLRAGFGFASGERRLRFRGFQSPFELETATHETMARAFLPAARLAYDGLRPFGEYVLAIARNYVLNQLRRHEALVLVGGAAELDDEAGGGAPAEAGPGPAQSVGESLEEREIHRLIAAFLDGAEPRERELFQLRFREERGQEEAARAMGLTRIQVRRAEHKLKKRLLEHLKRNGYLAGVSEAILGTGLSSVLL